LEEEADEKTDGNQPTVIIDSGWYGDFGCEAAKIEEKGRK
jgi:hypothetical protein